MGIVASPPVGGAPRHKGKHLASLGELPDGQAVLRRVGGRSFLVVRRGAEVRVCGHSCPHQGASLNEGLLVGSQIVCPCHQGRFELKGGLPVHPPARDDLPVYEVSVVGGDVFVGRPRPSRPWHLRRGSNDRRIVILGAGAAGSAAAESLRREGFDGRILLVSAEDELPYDRTKLSKEFLRAGRDIPEAGPGALSEEAVILELRPREFYEQAEIELLLGRKATCIEPAPKTIRFEDGRELAYDSLLLATGGRPRRMGLAGEKLSGCFTLRSHGDAVRIRGAAAAARSVVILGAGFLGLEMADSLSRRGLEVTVVAPEALPLAPVFGERLGRWILERHEGQGVRFRLATTARELRGDRRVREVILQDGSSLQAEMVIVAVGMEPAIGCLEGSGLLRNGAVPVDGRQKTPAPGVYAAGDLAAVPGPDGAMRRFEHWVQAEVQGRRAARALLGLEPALEGLPFFWTEAGGCTLKAVGIPVPGALASVRGRLDESSFLVGYFGRDSEKARLVGACAVGRDRELIAAGEHIRRGLALSAEELADESLDLPARLQSGGSLGLGAR